MGGFGSGQWVRLGTAWTTEEALDLDLAVLNARGHLKPFAVCSGSYSWTYSRTGELSGSIDYTVRTEANCGVVEFRYKIVSNGNGEDLRYQVALETTRPHLGGVRWWFRCPLSGNRARVLYKIVGQDLFACREALGLSYHCRNESVQDRMWRRSQKILKRIGVGRSTSAEFASKPKGMHWRTFEREQLKALEAEQRSADLWAEQVVAVLGDTSEADELIEFGCN